MNPTFFCLACIMRVFCLNNEMERTHMVPTKNFKVFFFSIFFASSLPNSDILITETVPAKYGFKKRKYSYVKKIKPDYEVFTGAVHMANDHLIEFHLIEIVIFQLIEISLIT